MDEKLLKKIKKRDKEAMKCLDKAVVWFGVEKVIEILYEYNQDFEGCRPNTELDWMEI